MEIFKNLKYILTEDSITLFWEKDVFLNENQYYSIYCDDKCVGTTKKTHFTVQNLESHRNYQIDLNLIEKNGDLDEKIIYSSKQLGLATAKMKRRLNICKAPFHAKGDGETLNTKAIQLAIDQCGEEECVYIPEGVFMTGALRLHSNMELYLEEGAVLQGTSEIPDYFPIIESRFEGIERPCYSSVLNIGYLNHKEGFDCENIVIRGKGTIASGGRILAEKIIADEKQKLRGFILSLGESIEEYENENTIPGRIRPRLVNISNARNVVISGVTLKDSASWNVHMIYSDNIITHHCKFYSQDVWNGDGWNPDSSTNCAIFDCTFFTGDDSIAIKSGKNPEGNIIARPSKGIWIFDCQSMVGHGISIGSEISGGIEDVHIWDCDMSRAKVGIEIKATKKRGGYVKNVRVENCATPRLLFHSVRYNDDGLAAKNPPVFENCSFEHIRIFGEYYETENTLQPCDAIEMCGFDEQGYKIKNISFSNLKIGNGKCEKMQRFVLRNCEGITFKNIEIL